jgi:hypothetical protein
MGGVPLTTNCTVIPQPIPTHCKLCGNPLTKHARMAKNRRNYTRLDCTNEECLLWAYKLQLVSRTPNRYTWEILWDARYGSDRKA